MKCSKGGDVMNGLAISDEYKRLCEEVEFLRIELVDIIIERDNLVMIECKNLETKYMMTIGVYEYKVYEFYCEVERIKRKIELVQAKLNRNEPIFMPLIEEQLDREYAEYLERLKVMMEDIDKAESLSKCKTMTEEESREFKKLYREIVKKLHPDLNPQITKRELELFHKAVEAYDNGDLDTLKTIALLIDSVDDKPLSEDTNNSVDKMKKHKAELEREINNIKMSIEQIKKEFPYNKKEILLNEDRINAEIEDLKLTMEHYKEVYAQYKERLKKMLGDTDG